MFTRLSICLASVLLCHGTTAFADAMPDPAEHDWEEIHPRPAADGDQATLQARAEEILADQGDASSAISGATSGTSAAEGHAPRPAELDAAQRELAKLTDRLADRELELTRLREAFEAEVARQASGGKDLE